MESHSLVCWAGSLTKFLAKIEIKLLVGDRVGCRLRKLQQKLDWKD